VYTSQAEFQRDHASEGHVRSREFSKKFLDSFLVFLRSLASLEGGLKTKNPRDTI